MARRTKEESRATRRTIIEAARAVFDQDGVARTSLEQVAAAAGVTRGAIYWHFANKAELFYAMRDAVQLPLFDCGDTVLEAADDTLDPLTRVERFLDAVLGRIASDGVTLQTFRIMTFKCEYVGEFSRDLETACRIHVDLKTKLTRVYRQARRRGLLRAGLSPSLAAADTIIFLSGLVKIWLIDEQSDLVQRNARRLVAQHIASKRALS